MSMQIRHLMIPYHMVVEIASFLKKSIFIDFVLNWVGPNKINKIIETKGRAFINNILNLKKVKRNSIVF
jgi:hypothetical protein